MIKLLFISFVLVFMTGSVWAADIEKDQAYATCATFIENEVSKLNPSLMRSEGTKVPPKYNYTDQGETHFLVWNMATPITLANPDGSLRKTGAVCEVNKKTGKIVYLAVSAREIIK